MTKKTTSFAHRRTLGATLLAGVMLGHHAAAEPVAMTNTVTLTNVVTITNYAVVTVTNKILTTNFSQSISTPEPERKPADLPPLDWVPPQDDFDWVQLKSGEWLKGRIKAMQDKALDFDSEEMDEQSFDWKDIRQLRSAHIMDVVFTNEEKSSGEVLITPTEVTIGDQSRLTVPRDQLLGLTPGGNREREYWSGKVSAGLTLRSGNSDQVDYSATAGLQRRTPSTRFKFDYTGNFSRTEGVESANNHRLNGEFDLWLSRRLYLILPGAEYYRDPFQNISQRYTASLGVGYDVVDRRNLEWSVTAGPAYQYVIYESSQPGEPTEKGAAALVFGTMLDWDITRKIEFILEYRGQYTSKEVGETTHHAVGTLSFDITKRLDLDVSLTWDRISNPKIGADGIQPKPDDFRLIVGLGLDF